MSFFYLHLFVLCDPGKFIHGHDVETLAEYGPLNLHGSAVPRQTERALSWTV